MRYLLRVANGGRSHAVFDQCVVPALTCEPVSPQGLAQRPMGSRVPGQTRTPGSHAVTDGVRTRYQRLLGGPRSGRTCVPSVT